MISSRGRGRRTAGGSQRRMKIKLREDKAAPALPADFEETTWGKLEAAVKAIHTLTPTPLTKPELFNAVESMCMHGMAPRLYERLADVQKKHTIETLSTLSGLTLAPEEFLARVRNVWNGHCEQTVIIRSVFLTLDRKYATATAGVKSIWDMGIHHFRSFLVDRSDTLGKIVSCILQVIERDRNGEAVERPLVATLVRMLSSLKLYESDFSSKFGDASREYFRGEASRTLSESDVPKYLKFAEERVRAERERVAPYLSHSSVKGLVSDMNDAFIRIHMDLILDKGFNQLVDRDALADLSRMFKMFTRVDGMDLVKARFSEHIKAKGMEIVNDTTNEKEMVPNLLALKKRMDSILTEAFENDDAFGYALKTAFETFINTRRNRPAELIAKYCDTNLRSGQKGKSDDEVEAALDAVMVLFRCVHGKDVFEAFYKKDLAKRLLLNRSASADLEKSMLTKLKTECGHAFTSKLEGMFKDVEVSRSIMKQFASTEHGLPFEPYVHVLTTTYWPTYKMVEVKLPRELVEAQETFSRYYLGKFQQSKRLTWQHGLGHCILRARFPSGRKELQVSLFQTIVLLQFNEGDKYTYPELVERTGLDEGNLKRTLQSLACGKVRIVRKTPKSRDINDTDEFEYNAEFKAKLIRIKINSIQAKETKEEQKDTEERVLQERQYQIDAAIVRIMKTRKSLKHQQLMAETLAQLRFPSKPADIKRRMESLIERDYLERDDDDHTIFKYVA